MNYQSKSKTRRSSFQFAALLPVFTFAATESAAQQVIAPKFVESATAPGVRVSASGAPGKAFAETLRGTGAKAGYLLTHGNVLPGSVFLTIGGLPQKINADYWLEAGSGSIYFANPVRSGDSVQVTYRYVDGADPVQNALLPGLRFSLGKSLNLGLMYGAAASNGAGLNISTYGLSLNSAFGAGKRSSLSSLFYVSNSQRSLNEVMPLGASGSAAQNKTSGQEAGSDHLFVQDLNAQAGGLLFHADYQDVGKKFNGFSTLRSNLAGDKAGLDKLTALEGERGIQRMGFGFGSSGAGAATGKPTTGGLQLNWNQISDEKGRISQEAAGYESSAFHVQFASREVGKTFQSFNGLRDAEKDQWKREAGLKTETLGFGFNFGPQRAKSPVSGLNFSSQKFGDISGELKRDTLQLTSGSFGLQMLNRSSDSGFKRLNDLSDADKTTLALDLYRQFDSGAKAEQVTAGDRAQIGHDAGLTRSALHADFGFGKDGRLEFFADGNCGRGGEGQSGKRAASRRFDFAVRRDWTGIPFAAQRSEIQSGQ